MIACVPAANVAVVKLTVPPLKATFARAVAPSVKLTLPSGVPELELTVAVNVTDCPLCDGFNELTRVVWVAAFCTTWFSAGEVLLANDESPEYTAVMFRVPADRADVLRVAAPEASATVPIGVVPSLKVAVPVGIPPDGEVTFALKFTVCP